LAGHRWNVVDALSFACAELPGRRRRHAVRPRLRADRGVVHVRPLAAKGERMRVRIALVVGMLAAGSALAPTPPPVVLASDRVAVALAPDGKVTGARVVELTEETYPWVKGLIDRGFLQNFNGRDAHASFAMERGPGSSMPQFYGNVIAGLVRRAALLYEAGIL